MMSADEIKARIAALCDEIEANEEENRLNEEEIQRLEELLEKLQ